MRSRNRALWSFAASVLIAALVVVGCTNPPPIPTLSSVEMALTSQFMTQNAPPAGFSSVSFAPIDINLDKLPHWSYTVSLSFEGVFADSQQRTTGTISAEVYSNELVGERRVVIRASGDAFGPNALRDVEGVRLSNEFYFVDQNAVCSRVTDDPNRRRVAELTAGSLVGGIRQATATTTNKQIINVQAWQYTFVPSAVDPPQLQMTQGGKVTIASGELWIAPSLNVVVDYNLTLDVSSVILPIFQGDRQLTGKVKATYRLVDTNTLYNIAIPFGC